jgi:hypothetical protein
MDPLERMKIMLNQYTGPQSDQITKANIILDIQNLVSEMELIKTYVTQPPEFRNVKAPALVGAAMELLFNHVQLEQIASLNGLDTMQVVELINQAVSKSLPTMTAEQRELWAKVIQYWQRKNTIPPWHLPEFINLILALVSTFVPEASLFTPHNVQIVLDVIQGLSPWQASLKNDTPMDYVIHILIQLLPLLFLAISPNSGLPNDLLEIRKWASEVVPLLEIYVNNQ